MKVNIIGGGIGGLMTAIALIEGGCQVSIFEQATTFGVVGAGIWMAPNALSIFSKFGLLEAVCQKGKSLSKASIIDTKGKLLSRIDFNKVYGKHKFGNVALHRAVLHQILLDKIPANVIRPGMQFLSFSQNNSAVTAFFANGTSEIADVLIAADGINSTVRSQLYPSQQLRNTKQLCWRFISDHSPTNWKRDEMYEIWGNERGLRVGYSYINEKQVYCYITSYDDQKESLRTVNVKQHLLKICEGFPQHVTEMIASVNENEIIQHRLFDLPFTGSWYSGRVVLLGDAAHASAPNLGQGGCQAIEDAYMLSKCICKITDLTQALEVYQKTRRPKATYIARSSWRLSQLANTTGIKKRVVKELFKIMPAFMADRMLDRMYSVDYMESHTGWKNLHQIPA